MFAPILIFLINLGRTARNLWRRLLRRRVDFVRIELSGTLPEFAPAPAWWRRRFLGASAPVSITGLRRLFEQVAADPYACGVLLYVNGPAAGWATIASLHDELARLREAGKRSVAYLLTPDSAGYLAACAADTLIVPPGAFFSVLGVRTEVQFLKDSLDRIGLQAELEAVSPYKSAGEPLVQSDISPENRAQFERLVEQRYAELVRTIAERRRLPSETVREAIDQAPLSAGAALQRGLVDTVAYEDELERLLTGDQGSRHTGGNETTQPGDGDRRLGTGRRAPIILDWRRARRALRLQPARHHRGVVAVVPVEGTITFGRSRSAPVPLPLIGSRQSGSDSFAQAIRQAERNRRIAAVVLYIDSPGGDSFASDLMWREVLRLRTRKPVVVAMGNAAASGGYYVAAPASAIVAQPGTITGSIGVFSLRVSAGELLDRVGVNTVVISRGARSGLLSASGPLSNDERQALRDQVMSIYAEFKQRVCDGRKFEEERLEAIAGGRVWTGREALELGLVDQLGGLTAALGKAQELAGLPVDRTAPLLLLGGGRGTLPPQPFPASSLAELPDLLRQTLKPRIWALLPFEMG